LIEQYIQLSTILIPLATLGAFLLGMHSSATQTEWTIFITWKTMGIVLIIVLGISIGGRWLQRRYFNWIYGKNLKRLQLCLDDLEEVEEGE